VENTSPRRWLLSALVAGSAFLGGCVGVCVGGVCMDSESPTSQAGVPLLHADDGVRIERLSSVLPYQPGMALQIGDVIETAGGFALIDFDDDNYVALRQNTRIQLGSIRLFLGEVFAHITQVMERGGGQVTTDELSASVTGTEYSVRRTPLSSRSGVDNTAVIVRKGTVRCEGRGDRRWPAVSLTDNRIFRVEGKQVPRPPQYVDAQAETAWADRAVQRLLVRRGSGVRPSFGITVPLGSPPRGGRPAPPPPSGQPTGDRQSTPPASTTYPQGR
jgi:FecR-like protein